MSQPDGAPGAETPAGDEPLDLRDELASAFDAPETAGVDPGTTAPAAPATAGTEQIQSLQAPKHWSEADRTLFAKAPPDIQKRWMDREGEFQKGVDGKSQELAALKREWDPILEAFKPFERDLGLMGISRPQFLGQLINVHKWLTEDPHAAMRWIAQQYQADLKKLVPDPSQPAADPTVTALQSKYESLEQRLERQDRERQQAEHASNLSRVTAFAEAKDEAGKPKHPYFDEVAQDIVALMRATGSKDIEAAYTKAIRMNEDVWNKIQAEKQASDKAKQDQTAAARLAKAKRAAVGTDGQVNGAAAPKSLRDELAEGFASLPS